MWKISMSKWDFQIHPTCKLKRTVRWRWSGLVYEGPRKQRCGSAIKRCGSVSLFSLWCGSGSDFTLWCGSGSTFNFDVNPDPDSSVHFDADADPDPAPYQSKTNLQPLEGFRPSTAPCWASRPQLWASTTLHGFNLSLHSSWFGSGSNLSLFTLIRIRIQHPKMMRIHVDLDPDPRYYWKFRSL